VIKRSRRGLPVIGFIKIGQPTSKKSARRGAPEKFDHLELTTTARDSTGRLEPNVEAIDALLEQGVTTCGGCERSGILAKHYKRPTYKNGLPTQARVFLPYDDLSLTCPNDLFYFRGSTVYCKGDMVAASRREVLSESVVDGQKRVEFGDFFAHQPCGSQCPDFVSRRCKPYGKLKCILTCQENVGGCYEFRTTSWTTIGNVLDGLEFIQDITGGVLRWVPLRLDLVQTTVTVKQTGIKSKPWVLQVTYPEGPQKLREHVARMLEVEAPMMSSIKQLEATLVGERQFEELSEPVEVQAIKREWHPDLVEEEEPDAEPSTDDAPPEEEQTEVASTETGAVMREVGAQPDEERCTKGWQTLAKAKAKFRATKGLELTDEDAPATILHHVLEAHGIPEIAEVFQSEQEEIIRAIETYELPS
jgi:hypothetical protein